MLENILVTVGAGFIGANLVRLLMDNFSVGCRIYLTGENGG